MLGWAFLKRAWPGWSVNLLGQGQAEPCWLEHQRTRQKVLVQVSDSVHWSLRTWFLSLQPSWGLSWGLSLTLTLVDAAVL